MAPPATGRPRSAALLPLLAAALVAVAGAALLWAGLARTSAFGGGGPLTGRLPAVTAPVVVTAPGMSELSGSAITVRAAAPPGRRVFVGLGRADDVEAYLGGAARAEVTALEPDGTLRVSVRGGEAALPDPAGVDVWAAAAQGTGPTTLRWPRAPGAWRVVVAVDGRTAPASAEFTWSGEAGASPAPALIAVGAVLLVAGLAGLAAIRSGRVFARATSGGAPGAAGARPRGGPAGGLPDGATDATDDATDGVPDDATDGDAPEGVATQPFRRRRTPAGPTPEEE